MTTQEAVAKRIFESYEGQRSVMDRSGFREWDSLSGTQKDYWRAEAAIALQGGTSEPTHASGSVPPCRAAGCREAHHGISDGKATDARMGTAAAFVAKALEMAGKPYVFGAEADLKDKSPEAFDCSELVQWAAAQAGGMMPDGSAYQLRFCEGAGTRLSPEQAMLVRGGLLFRPGHVAISLGDGRTIEARGKAYGVGEFHAEGRGWTAGALVPGMRY